MPEPTELQIRTAAYLVASHPSRSSDLEKRVAVEAVWDHLASLNRRHVVTRLEMYGIDRERTDAQTVALYDALVAADAGAEGRIEEWATDEIARRAEDWV